MSSNKKVWVYDVEQFPNFHSCTFMNRDNENDIRQFVIYKERNDIEEYYEFLKTEVSGLIGFNNVNYDYPMLHEFIYIMKAYSRQPDPDKINDLLFAHSQKTIEAEYSAVEENKVMIPQLDLYRIHHFDNKAKATSLKAVEIAIQFPNVQDLPFDENHIVESHEVQTILDYNLNDVKATYKFYELSKDLVELRKKLSAKYNINLRNANDPKIGQEIFIRQIAKKKGWSYSFVKEMRTFRHYIDLGQCILDYIKFESDEFNELLTDLKSTVIETTYDAFDKSVLYKGFRYDYGTGGIHGCIAPGVYEANDEYFILDIDVEGFYPNLSISNNFYPQHLGPEFVDVYKEIVALKEEAGRTGDKITRSGMKLAGNGVYGFVN